ncbi:Fe(3+) dicitrate ABC transporter ATP-binding protein FecE [Pseudomonas monteilii]|uniref:Fe(3+) dicitrate ABC transporter ATP-binding protein FecE n=1 Tax=Pseudomonas monteilii TaxID=76759 RepID=UPI003800B9C9
MSIIQARSVDVGYGTAPIVKGLSFAPPAGKVTALIGPNGCGKSTLLKALAGIIRPSAGSVLVDGSPLPRLKNQELARRVSFLPQVLPIPEGVSVRQLIAYGRSPHNSFWGRLSGTDKGHVDQAIKRMELEALADRPLSDLSGGQRQRAWLAMVLAQDTEVVLLDEPTTYLDICHQVELLDLMQDLASNGKTVIMVLHDINQACRYADHIAVMRSGILVANGSPAEIMSIDLVKEVFEVQVKIINEPVLGTPMCVVERSSRG